MRISDWSSDVCSSDLLSCLSPNGGFENPIENLAHRSTRVGKPLVDHTHAACPPDVNSRSMGTASELKYSMTNGRATSEHQPLLRLLYAVFCLKKNTQPTSLYSHTTHYILTLFIQSHPFYYFA